jgi:presequence protease
MRLLVEIGVLVVSIFLSDIVMLSARRPAAWSLRKAGLSLRPVRVGRTYASITDLSKYPKPGEKLHGFTLQRAQHVPELELTALHLQHDQTGADYLHIARDDSNNVFSIGFKTNPPDATGVPHILEHTTLCGSEK